MKNLKIITSVLSVLLLVGLTLPVQAAVIINQKIPVNIDVPIPCAGEDVILSGNLHTVIAITDDGAGGFHVKVQNNPQGISGISTISGDKYQATGVTENEFNYKGLGEQSTFINNFRIIGQGPGNNYIVHATFHITINADGIVTAIADNFNIDCK